MLDQTSGEVLVNAQTPPKTDIFGGGLLKSEISPFLSYQCQNVSARKDNCLLDIFWLKMFCARVRLEKLRQIFFQNFLNFSGKSTLFGG